MTVTTTPPTSVPLGTYLAIRLAQLGLKHVFGVPGDFNLTLLDHIEASPDLTWIGFCNELNAAYAADGYARVKGTPMTLITTYGVGELSALNGIAGAFAENVPVIHIVGTTGRPIQEAGLLIHHVPPPKGHAPLPANHRIYPETSKPFSVAQEYLLDPRLAPSQIDSAISAAYKQALPVYIYVPVDMVAQPLPKHLLDTPLDLAIESGLESEQEEDSLVDEILTTLYAAKSPVILADTLSERFRLREEITNLVKKAQIPSFSTLLGKGLVDETSPYFAGVYNGELSHTGIAEAVHASDCVLNLGPLLSDSNTGGFTRKIKSENAIILHPLYVQVGDTPRRDGISFVPIVKKLVARLDPAKLQHSPLPQVTLRHDRPSPTPISLASLIHNVSTQFLRPGDVVIPEVGTVQFASPDFIFPADTRIITQVFYSSIGFSLPAAVGAAFAQRELNPANPSRVVLLEGDGSAQMTIQELGTMVRNKLNIAVFLLNNSGYSIERAIWGPQQGYNDICPDWKWTQLLSAFGGSEAKSCLSTRIETKKEEEEFFTNGIINKSDLPRLIEVILHPNNYPWRLDDQVKFMGAQNIAMYKEYSAKHD
ncbi:uncharacterized protein SAPINGB_P000432 [Magnusiomyces paraingens]|uniref:Pyruvate decarboxylase n=1 Tax=Magnusiomyces paraingens TaxID=2606893 RepID=A0A5E8B0L6_9ASCO|nr:uncharacterized protein SAPINGB_P000432 [Saprochaete ingens]VVT44485.1 unnamed protein product [Saprochaete ingens]